MYAGVTKRVKKVEYAINAISHDVYKQINIYVTRNRSQVYTRTRTLCMQTAAEKQNGTKRIHDQKRNGSKSYKKTKGPKTKNCRT